METFAQVMFTSGAQSHKTLCGLSVEGRALVKMRIFLLGIQAEARVQNGR